MEDDESWVDITSCFKEACVSLAEGELFCDDKFGLVEAMTAIEIMDPKMDSTAALFSLGREILTFEEGISSGAVKVDNLSIEELVGIMDETIATLVTWLDGQNILQTVFTNLYLHDHKKIRDNALKAFVVLVLKFVNWVINHTYSSRVCYEEDFATVYQLSFDLANDLTDSEAFSQAKEAEKALAEKASSDKRFQLVSSRIACFRLMLQCLTTCGNYTGISQYERDAEFLAKSFISLKHLLETMKTSVDIGVKPENSSPELDSSSATRFDYPAIMGFDPLANQHLLPPTLPRAPFIKSRQESILFLEKLMEDLQLLLTQPDVRYEPWEFFDFLTSFTSRAPNVLVRLIGRDMLSTIVNNAGETSTSPNGGKPEVNEATGIVPHMCQVFLNCSDFSAKSLQQMSAETRANVQVFLTNLTSTLVSYIQLHFLNLSRQRDKIGKLLDQMGVITDQAETVDNLLAAQAKTIQNPSPAAEKPRLELLTTFLTTCMQMRYVLLGFQLGIYSAHEFRYVFAGLAEHFMRYYVAFIENAHAIVVMSSTPHGSSKSARHKAKAKSGPPPSALHLEELMHLAQSYYSLCMAYFFLTHGMILDRRISTPRASKFDDEGRRYFYRFSPFANVTRPPYFSYEMYHRVFEQIFHDCVSPAKSYQQATIYFSHARRGFENLKGAQLKWQTMFAMPCPLPRPSNPIMPTVTVIKRILIVLNILMSELPSSGQQSFNKSANSTGHSTESKSENTGKDSAQKGRTKIAFVFSNSTDFPSLEVVKN